MTTIAQSPQSARRPTAHPAIENLIAPQPDLSVRLAQTTGEVRESQQLRYSVFAGELGAALKSDSKADNPELDSDHYDAYCHHLLVRDRKNNQVVASTRVLSDVDARRAGGFYSANEFDLTPLLSRKLRLLEIGRTCVHPDYRTGAAISSLWMGLARYFDINQFDYLIGCASIPLYDGGAGAYAAYVALAQKYAIDPDWQCAPTLPLPARADDNAHALLPPLLKAYIRLGAKIGGAPCLDPAFNCADLLILLDPAQLQRRYARKFLCSKSA